MNKTKNSIFNALTMLCNTMIISILGLVSTNLIIKNYGSDVNGLVATANQIVNLLLILEGGFTLAVNVSLYNPFISRNYSLINKILSEAKKSFLKIGLIFLLIGLFISLIYPFYVKSDLDYLTIFLIFSMVIISTSYNLIFTIRHQIMFQVSQKEYLYTFISILINIFSNLTTILLAYLKVNILYIRFSALIYLILNGLLIYILFKKHFSYVKFNCSVNNKLVNGTKDLLVQKLTSVVYSSFPILFISTFVGTKMSSVYVVYNSIYSIIRNGVNAIISAPVNAFGQLISDNKFTKAYKRFQLYEFIVIFITGVLLSTALCLIIPFVRLYTINIKETNYINIYIAIMLALSVYLELIHIPSGHIINVAGKFKVSKNINIFVSIVLIILLLFLGIKYNLYGILFAIIITNVILAFLEIYYVHCNIFSHNLKKIGCVIILNLLLIIGLLLFINKFNLVFYNYFDFIKYGLIILIFNFFIILIVNYIFFGKMIREFILIIKNLLKKRFIRE